MPQKKRLPRREFRSRWHRAVRTPFFSLKMKSNESEGARIGIVVGKSVHKTAVKRNFWKRQARSVLESAVRGDHDLILVIQPRVNELTRKKFRETLARAIRDIQ